MKRLKRTLWLTAWCVWLWLGFGLARELPREFQEVCTLPLEERSRVLGFVRDSNEVAVHHVRDRSPTVDVYDVSEGFLLRTSIGPLKNDVLPTPISGVNPHDGYFLARRLPDGTTGVTGLHSLDLATGAWRRLTPRVVQRASFHGHRPWLLVEERAAERFDPRSIVVMNLETGEELFVRTFSYTETTGEVFFLRGSSRLAISRSAFPQSDPAAKAEVWDLDDLSKPLEMMSVKNAQSQRWMSSVRSALHRPLQANRRPRDDQPGWTLRSFEAVGGSVPHWPHMLLEKWFKLWEKRFPLLRFETRAFRSRENGELLFRTMKTWPAEAAPNVNADGMLFVTPNGVVYAFPPRVNWPLLVLCQTLLALPLVFLWTALRWRRKRRMRLASVTL